MHSGSGGFYKITDSPGEGRKTSNIKFNSETQPLLSASDDKDLFVNKELLIDSAAGLLSDPTAILLADLSDDPAINTRDRRVLDRISIDSDTILSDSSSPEPTFGMSRPVLFEYSPNKPDIYLNPNRAMTESCANKPAGWSPDGNKKLKLKFSPPQAIKTPQRTRIPSTSSTSTMGTGRGAVKSAPKEEKKSRFVIKKFEAVESKAPVLRSKSSLVVKSVQPAQTAQLSKVSPKKLPGPRLKPLKSEVIVAEVLPRERKSGLRTYQPVQPSVPLPSGDEMVVSHDRDSGIFSDTPQIATEDRNNLEIPICKYPAENPHNILCSAVVTESSYVFDSSENASLVSENTSRGRFSISKVPTIKYPLVEESTCDAEMNEPVLSLDLQSSDRLVGCYPRKSNFSYKDLYSEDFMHGDGEGIEHSNLDDQLKLDCDINKQSLCSNIESISPISLELDNDVFNHSLEDENLQPIRIHSAEGMVESCSSHGVDGESSWNLYVPARRLRQLSEPIMPRPALKMAGVGLQNREKKQVKIEESANIIFDHELSDHEHYMSSSTELSIEKLNDESDLQKPNCDATSCNVTNSIEFSNSDLFPSVEVVDNYNSMFESISALKSEEAYNDEILSNALKGTNSIIDNKANDLIGNGSNDLIDIILSNIPQNCLNNVHISASAEYCDQFRSFDRSNQNEFDVNKSCENQSTDEYSDLDIAPDELGYTSVVNNNSNHSKDTDLIKNIIEEIIRPEDRTILSDTNEVKDSENCSNFSEIKLTDLAVNPVSNFTENSTTSTTTFSIVSPTREATSDLISTNNEESKSVEFRHTSSGDHLQVSGGSQGSQDGAKTESKDRHRRISIEVIHVKSRGGKKGGEAEESESGEEVTDITEDEEEKEVSSSPNGRFLKLNVEIGRGSFKTVYKGLDTDTGVHVAWCELQERTWHKGEHQRFVEEAKMLKTLQHPNIVQFYDFFQETRCKGKKVIVLITELMTSGTLKTYIRRFKKINLKVLKSWCRQVLQGLDYLHGRTPKVIHRDLKCDNIFITGTTGSVKIGDLGLATLMTKSFAKSCIGTPEFMAPEMYEEQYNESVDVYAFGMCVLEMSTSEYPYEECKSTAAIYRRVTKGVRPEAFDRVTNPDIKDIIEKCTVMDVEKRCSVKQLLELDFFREDSGIVVDLTDEGIVSEEGPTIQLWLRISNERRKKQLKLLQQQLPAGERPTLQREDEAIQFDFNVETDDPEDVAREMVKSGYVLPDDVRLIARQIRACMARTRVRPGRFNIGQVEPQVPGSAAAANQSSEPLLNYKPVDGNYKPVDGNYKPVDGNLSVTQPDISLHDTVSTDNNAAAISSLSLDSGIAGSLGASGSLDAPLSEVAIQPTAVVDSIPTKPKDRSKVRRRKSDWQMMNLSLVDLDETGEVVECELETSRHSSISFKFNVYVDKPSEISDIMVQSGFVSLEQVPNFINRVADIVMLVTNYPAAARASIGQNNQLPSNAAAALLSIGQNNPSNLAARASIGQAAQVTIYPTAAAVSIGQANLLNIPAVESAESLAVMSDESSLASDTAAGSLPSSNESSTTEAAETAAAAAVFYINTPPVLAWQASPELNPDIPNASPTKNKDNDRNMKFDESAVEVDGISEVSNNIKSGGTQVEATNDKNVHKVEGNGKLSRNPSQRNGKLSGAALAEQLSMFLNIPNNPVVNQSKNIGDVKSEHVASELSNQSMIAGKQGMSTENSTSITSPKPVSVVPIVPPISIPTASHNLKQLPLIPAASGGKVLDHRELQQQQQQQNLHNNPDSITKVIQTSLLPPSTSSYSIPPAVPPISFPVRTSPVKNNTRVPDTPPHKVTSPRHLGLQLGTPPQASPTTSPGSSTAGPKAALVSSPQTAPVVSELYEGDHGNLAAARARMARVDSDYSLMMSHEGHHNSGLSSQETSVTRSVQKQVRHSVPNALDFEHLKLELVRLTGPKKDKVGGVTKLTSVGELSEIQEEKCGSPRSRHPVVPHSSGVPHSAGVLPGVGVPHSAGMPHSAGVLGAPQGFGLGVGLPVVSHNPALLHNAVVSGVPQGVSKAPHLPSVSHGIVMSGIPLGGILVPAAAAVGADATKQGLEKAGDKPTSPNKPPEDLHRAVGVVKASSAASSRESSLTRQQNQPPVVQPSVLPVSQAIVSQGQALPQQLVYPQVLPQQLHQNLMPQQLPQVLPQNLLQNFIPEQLLQHPMPLQKEESHENIHSSVPIHNQVASHHQLPVPKEIPHGMIEGQSRLDQQILQQAQLLQQSAAIANTGDFKDLQHQLDLLKPNLASIENDSTGQQHSLLLPNLSLSNSSSSSSLITSASNVSIAANSNTPALTSILNTTAVQSIVTSSNLNAATESKDANDQILFSIGEIPSGARLDSERGGGDTLDQESEQELEQEQFSEDEIRFLCSEQSKEICVELRRLEKFVRKHCRTRPLKTEMLQALEETMVSCRRHIVQLSYYPRKSFNMAVEKEAENRNKKRLNEIRDLLEKMIRKQGVVLERLRNPAAESVYISRVCEGASSQAECAERLSVAIVNQQRVIDRLKGIVNPDDDIGNETLEEFKSEASVTFKSIVKCVEDFYSADMKLSEGSELGDSASLNSTNDATKQIRDILMKVLPSEITNPGGGGGLDIRKLLESFKGCTLPSQPSQLVSTGAIGATESLDRDNAATSVGKPAWGLDAINNVIERLLGQVLQCNTSNQEKSSLQKNEQITTHDSAGNDTKLVADSTAAAPMNKNTEQEDSAAIAPSGKALLYKRNSTELADDEVSSISRGASLRSEDLLKMLYLFKGENLGPLNLGGVNRGYQYAEPGLVNGAVASLLLANQLSVPSQLTNQTQGQAGGNILSALPPGIESILAQKERTLGLNSTTTWPHIHLVQNNTSTLTQQRGLALRSCTSLQNISADRFSHQMALNDRNVSCFQNLLASNVQVQLMFLNINNKRPDWLKIFINKLSNCCTVTPEVLYSDLVSLSRTLDNSRDPHGALLPLLNLDVLSLIHCVSGVNVFNQGLKKEEPVLTRRATVGKLVRSTAFDAGNSVDNRYHQEGLVHDLANHMQEILGQGYSLANQNAGNTVQDIHRTNQRHENLGQYLDVSNQITAHKLGQQRHMDLEADIHTHIQTAMPGNIMMDTQVDAHIHLGALQHQQSETWGRTGNDTHTNTELTQQQQQLMQQLMLHQLLLADRSQQRAADQQLLADRSQLRAADQQLTNEEAAVRQVGGVKSSDSYESLLIDLRRALDEKQAVSGQACGVVPPAAQKGLEVAPSSQQLGELSHREVDLGSNLAASCATNMMPSSQTANMMKSMEREGCPQKPAADQEKESLMSRLLVLLDQKEQEQGKIASQNLAQGCCDNIQLSHNTVLGPEHSNLHSNPPLQGTALLHPGAAVLGHQQNTAELQKAVAALLSQAHGQIHPNQLIQNPVPPQHTQLSHSNLPLHSVLPLVNQNHHVNVQPFVGQNNHINVQSLVNQNNPFINTVGQPNSMNQTIQPSLSQAESIPHIPIEVKSQVPEETDIVKLAQVLLSPPKPQQASRVSPLLQHLELQQLTGREDTKAELSPHVVLPGTVEPMQGLAEVLTLSPQRSLVPPPPSAQTLNQKSLTLATGLKLAALLKQQQEQTQQTQSHQQLQQQQQLQQGLLHQQPTQQHQLQPIHQQQQQLQSNQQQQTHLQLPQQNQLQQLQQQLQLQQRLQQQLSHSAAVKNPQQSDDLSPSATIRKQLSQLEASQLSIQRQQSLPLAALIQQLAASKLQEQHQQPMGEKITKPDTLSQALLHSQGSVHLPEETLAHQPQVLRLLPAAAQQISLQQNTASSLVQLLPQLSAEYDQQQIINMLLSQAAQHNAGSHGENVTTANPSISQHVVVANPSQQSYPCIPQNPLCDPSQLAVSHSQPTRIQQQNTLPLPQQLLDQSHPQKVGQQSQQHQPIQQSQQPGQQLSEETQILQLLNLLTQQNKQL